MGYPPTIDILQWRLTYTVTLASSVLTHQHNIYLKPDGALPAPGTAISSINVLAQNGTTRTVIAWQSDYVAIYRQLFGAEMSVVGSEVWAYDAGSSDANFITASTIIAVGNNVNPCLPAKQRIFTARTFTGRIVRIDAQEQSSIDDNKVVWNQAPGQPAGDLRELIVEDTDRCPVARDGSYLLAALFDGRGQNEANWRRRFRP